MSEIKLQCPECGTEYRLPEGAIPEQGRQVECTSCDHIWLAFAEKPGSAKAFPEDPASSARQAGGDNAGIIRHLPDSSDSEMSDGEAETSDAEPAPLKRRLPEDVLNILREEVEFERRARRGEITENSSPNSDQDEPEESWPATTITDTGAVSDFRSPPHSLPLNELPPESRTDNNEISRRAVALIPAKTPPEAVGAEPARRNGYVAGFSAALTVAAAAFAVYIIAPDFSENDRFGPSLSQYREMVDAGRGWLEDQASRLTQRN